MTVNYRYGLMIGLVALLLSFAAPGTGMAAGDSVQAANASPDALTNVAARDNTFVPQNLTIAAGTTIRWANQGYNNHTATSDTGVWESGTLNPGAQYSYTFNTPGVYLYHCTFHRNGGMVGRIEVTGGGGVPGPSPAGSLALGKLARASTAQAGHGPELAVDGSAETYWASNTGNGAVGGTYNSQWIYVDLGANYAVQRMHMSWNSGHHARVYSIYVYGAGCAGWCQIGTTSSGDGDDTLALARSVYGRVFLLGLSYNAAASYDYQLREWEIFGTNTVPQPPPSTGNLARHQPARASSEQPGYRATNATDGNLVTEWRSTRLPGWILVDFGRMIWVNRAVLRWSPETQVPRFQLLVNNGSYWYTITNPITGGNGDSSVTFRSVSTRYLMLYVASAASGNVGLREFEVYGSASGGGSPVPYGADEGQWKAQPDVPAPNVVPDGVAPESLAPDGMAPEVMALEFVQVAGEVVDSAKIGPLDLNTNGDVTTDLPEILDLR